MQQTPRGGRIVSRAQKVIKYLFACCPSPAGESQEQNTENERHLPLDVSAVHQYRLCLRYVASRLTRDVTLSQQW